MEYFRHRFLLSLVIILLSVIIYPTEMLFCEICAEHIVAESTLFGDTLETTTSEQTESDEEPNSDAGRRNTKHYRAKMVCAHSVEDKRAHIHTQSTNRSAIADEDIIIKRSKRSAALYCRFRI